MEKIITFIAKDGKKFDDGILCAEHELNLQPELIEEINKKAYKKSMDRWCDSQACACSGCANHTFYNLGLQREHHEAWLQKFKTDMHYDGYDMAKIMKIKLIETSSIQKFILYLKKHYLFRDLNTVDIYKQLSSKIIFENDEYYYIESLRDYLQKYEDVKFEITN